MLRLRTAIDFRMYWLMRVIDYFVVELELDPRQSNSGFDLSPTARATCGLARLGINGEFILFYASRTVSKLAALCGSLVLPVHIR